MTNDQLKIQSFCLIRDNKAFLNGELLIEDISDLPAKDFLKKLYRHLKPGHSKFFKMDTISKLGFLAAELTLKDVDLGSSLPEERAIVLSNADSTLDTDSEHQKMIQDDKNFYPSPSVFVYTLPNIMIGEISIRYEMRGENAFFVVEKFNSSIITDHINSLFLKHKSKIFIGGWVNTRKQNYEAFMYLVSQNGHLPHTTSQIEKLYNTQI